MLCSLWFNWKMNFDPRVALNYAAAISRPRKVGSGEDERVAQEIEDRLCGWGYHVERQAFTFSMASEVFLKLFVLASMLLVVVLLLSHDRVVAVMLVLLVAAFMPLQRVVQARALEQNGRGLKWGRRYTTANLIATYPERSREAAKSKDALPRLYLIAHYDSKSQRMPLVMRITLFMLAIIAGLILVMLTLFDGYTILYLPIGLFALAAALPLLFLDVGNTSPGAIDNASSVGLVLHLAESAGAAHRLAGQIADHDSHSQCRRNDADGIGGLRCGARGTTARASTARRLARTQLRRCRCGGRSVLRRWIASTSKR